MKTVDPSRLKESLSRVAKIDADTGLAEDFEAAVHRLHGHRVRVAVGPEAAASGPHQAALLTFVNVARRFALGGVYVEGALDGVVLAGPLPGRPLRDEVRRLGGILGPPPDGCPTVWVGTCEGNAAAGIAATFEGWRGGVAKPGDRRLGERTDVVPAAALAGALAAAEAFAMLRGEATAGLRSTGLSLWRPGGDANWADPSSDGPDLETLPDHLWVLGLGHLGQAFLWTLMLCPFPDPGRVRVTLHDMDRVTGSSDSTSILTQPSMLGLRKARAVAAVLEDRGFETTVIERPFDGRFSHDPANDPAVLVCGVDNALTRSRMESPGFPFVVEAGIGHRAENYRALRVHTFPSPGKDAATLWGSSAAMGPSPVEHRAYRRLAEEGGDVCGLAQLAETAVGAPFVGAVAGTLMVAQILRLLAGDAPDRLVDLDLRSPRSRRAVRNDALSSVVPSFQRIHSLDVRAIREASA